MSEITLPNIAMQFAANAHGNLSLTVMMGYEDQTGFCPPKQSTAVLDGAVLDKILTKAIGRHTLNPNKELAENIDELTKKINGLMAEIVILKEAVEILQAVNSLPPATDAPAEEVSAW